MSNCIKCELLKQRLISKSPLQLQKPVTKFINIVQWFLTKINIFKTKENKSMFEIKLTEQEVNLLLQFIDLAVRGQGIQVAESAVVLNNKIRSEVLSQTRMNPKESKKE